MLNPLSEHSEFMVFGCGHLCSYQKQVTKCPVCREEGFLKVAL